MVAIGTAAAGVMTTGGAITIATIRGAGGGMSNGGVISRCFATIDGKENVGGVNTGTIIIGTPTHQYSDSTNAIVASAGNPLRGGASRRTTVYRFRLVVTSR
ncbi:hypothetical protein EAM01S_15_01270 [Erwinia amylovora NBRC 12687 = CFBP 1232]|nr:hypothetical protein EAM01S_15_01270 [Erwinia amylovora NBRC 12687 = CFBP 1232]